MTPASLSFVQNVALPFHQAWSNFVPCANKQRDLRHLAQTVYKPSEAQQLPQISRDILKDYTRLFRDLKEILKREGAPLYLVKIQRDWHVTVSRGVQELIDLTLDVTDKAMNVRNAATHQAFQTSVLTLTDRVQQSHDKFWQMEIGMRVALGINQGEEAKFFNPDPDAAESS